MSRLFGTDGVRGVAGEFLSAELAFALGRAAALDAESERPRVLIVRDTRESGEMLQSALAAGVSAAAGEALLGGVLPTPAAPLLVKRYGLDLAVVISASHNPYRDNGLKFFAADGFKLSDEAELAIEQELDESLTAGGNGVSVDGRASHGSGVSGNGGASAGNGMSAGGRASNGNGALGEVGNGTIADGAVKVDADAQPAAIGHVRELRGTHEDYLRELQSRFSELRLDGLDILIDCANGATYKVAPEIFKRLGANVTVVAANPDGRNINAGCGSTHIEKLGEQVVAGGHALGFAFDGDGDRVLAVDRAGVVVDGDELIALVALHLRAHQRLTGDGVVVTVMTNYGFHTAMRHAGIEVACTTVGDRYVLEELRRQGWTLGGEQSGHIIDMSFNSTGDGIASALLTLEALGGRDLSERHAMEKLPQRLVNVRVRDRGALAGAEDVARAVKTEDDALAGRGRVLVRPSGTEPLVRVMVEAPTDAEAEAACARLVALVQSELG